MNPDRKMPQILPAGRLRKSPYHASTIAEGAESFVTYNRMLIPRGYGDHEAEYWRLLNAVSMWDVAVQRQVQIKGPDATELVQKLCVRDLSSQVIGQGKYVAVCDHQGILLNDPIAMKIADDCYWLSIGNSDIWFWANCVAGERGFDVKVSEPDVSPMAVQGPKAEDVVASIFGDWVRELKYFWFKPAEIEGIPVMVVRAGWSKQGGFELFLMDGAKADHLWRIVKEAGQPFGIGPGYPNPAERTESGLLNWGIDTDEDTNPFEVRMGRFIDLDVANDVIGVKALRKIKAEGVKRHQLGVVLDLPEEREDQSARAPLEINGKRIGAMTHKAWSYRLQKVIGYGLVSIGVSVGDQVIAKRSSGDVTGRLVDIPFPIPT
ncbi:MAG: glycine cleavage system protein T [Pseudomonadota bacterium]